MEVLKKSLKMAFTCLNGVPMRWLCPLLILSKILNLCKFNHYHH